MGTGESEEHAAHSVEEHTALLISEDGVLEVRFLLVVDDLLNVLTLVLDGSLDGRQVITLLNLAEVWRTKWQGARREQWVLFVTCSRCLGE